MKTYTAEHCRLAIAASEKHAALPQHPLSRVFWQGTAQLWRERLAAAQ